MKHFWLGNKTKITGQTRSHYFLFFFVSLIFKNSYNGVFKIITRRCTRLKELFTVYEQKVY